MKCTVFIRVPIKVDADTSEEADKKALWILGSALRNMAAQLPANIGEPESSDSETIMWEADDDWYDWEDYGGEVKQ